MAGNGTPVQGAAGINGSNGSMTAQTGTAGGASTMNGAAGAGMTDPTMYPDPRGACTINSGFPDDHACLLPPKAGEGIQIHVGPSSYDDPNEVNKYVFHAGSESAECWTFHTPNTDKIYYQTFVISGRSGTHHIINTMYNTALTDGGFTVCQDPGTGTNGNIIDNLPGASRAYMPRLEVAPENAHIGRAIGPNVPSQADMHYFNFTDKDILREFWMNIYTVSAEQITQEANQIRAMGGITWTILPIQPGTDMEYNYSCPIDTDGRIIELLGHFHAHGKHQSASIQHADGMVEKLFEMYDYLDPAMFPYDSVSKNPAFSATQAGAVSGMVEVKAGDTFLWDCHIVNDGNVALSYTNEVKTGEMCNVWGESLGPKINCVQ
jgi:hypothetical protein